MTPYLLVHNYRWGAYDLRIQGNHRQNST